MTLPHLRESVARYEVLEKKRKEGNCFLSIGFSLICANKFSSCEMM